MQFRAPKGTRDLLPPESTRARHLVNVFAELAEQAGFGLIVPPMFEEIGVFERLGAQTDVVSKEMYAFETRGGDRVALRPEQTASVVRAFVQHRPTTPWKAWYAGPNFRYERPQRGRFRQFDQVGVELMGTEDPAADVEVIALAARFFEALGLRRVTLRVNSLGDRDDRRRYADTLRAHFESADLGEQARETLARNPLRVLDSKRPEDAAAIATAPHAELSSDAAAAFDRVLAGLDALGVAHEVDRRLVRGLDYYVRTTFEFAGAGLGATQDAVGGGGRYDDLAGDLGGSPTPGIGFALGVDRTLLSCDEEGVFAAPASSIDVFVVDAVDGTHATILCDELRRAGIGADRAYDARSLRSQMKKADSSGARVALIVGQDEVDAGQATVKDLRTGEQERVEREAVVKELRRIL